MRNMIEVIHERHDDYVNQKYGEGDLLPYSFHLKMVLAQGMKFYHLINQDEYIGKFQMYFNIEKVMDAALSGHDLIEDARMTRNDVVSLMEEFFFPESAEFIANIIYAVTDEKGWNRKERKNEKFYNELKSNKLAVFVKLADMASNMLYSKSFNSYQYKMYKNELPKMIEELYLVEYDEFFEYLKSL